MVRNHIMRSSLDSIDDELLEFNKLGWELVKLIPDPDKVNHDRYWVAVFRKEESDEVKSGR